jgi:glutamine synthetase
MQSNGSRRCEHALGGDPSQGEIARAHRTGVAALNDAILFRTPAKVLAKHHDLTLTLIARPLPDADGQTSHAHLSLLDKDGSNVFHDTSDDHGVSSMQWHFIGGVQKLLPE